MPDTMQVIDSGAVLALTSLKEAAAGLLKRYKPVKVWLFSGEMGAGKTTMIKALCEQLGVTEVMSSPTFSIINEYESSHGGKVFHFDFYRLTNEGEALDLGVEEYFESGHYCFVEWPERIPSLIPERHVDIALSPRDASHRIIHHTVHD